MVVVVLLVVVTVVDGTAMVDVVVLGAGHWQFALQTAPPAQLEPPGGSHASPLDTIPSPHCTSQLVPPALQQLRQVDENPRQVRTAARRPPRAVFRHRRFALPLPVQLALLVWNAVLELARHARFSALQLTLQGLLLAAAGYAQRPRTAPRDSRHLGSPKGAVCLEWTESIAHRAAPRRRESQEADALAAFRTDPGSVAVCQESVGRGRDPRSRRFKPLRPLPTV